MLKEKEISLTPKRQILNLLIDGGWHRNKEFMDKVDASSATIQKILNTLEKGSVERKIDTESTDYPRPVIYRLRNPELARSIEDDKKLAQMLVSNITAHTGFSYSAIADFLDNTHYNFNIRLLLNLLLFFSSLPKNNDDPQTIEKIKAFRENAYKEYLENLIMPDFVNWLSILKEKLEDLEKQGADVLALLHEANGQIMGDATQRQQKKIRRIEAHNKKADAYTTKYCCFCKKIINENSWIQNELTKDKPAHIECYVAKK